MVASSQVPTKSYILLNVISFWIIFLGLFIGISLLYNFLPGGYTSTLRGLRHGITGTLVVVIVLWLFLRREKKTFRDIELVWRRGTLPRFLAGLLLGSIIFMLMMLALYAFVGLRFTRTNVTMNGLSLLALLAFVPISWMEEAAFRSYPMLKLQDAFGIRAAQFIVAIAFAFYHMANGWSIYISFTGPFVWSFVFGLAAVWSKGIALPAGIHTALNILQSVMDLKDSGKGFWKPFFTGPATEAIRQRAASTGLFLHALVFFFALIALVYYQKWNHYKQPGR